jgi:LAO/AO transport system kinase
LSLANKILAGDRHSLARALTLIENESPEGLQILSELHAETGRAHRVGVTGAPGTGKSTLVNQLTLHLRQRDQAPSVAIVAVDPTSPFTGGAILGDRIRMRDLSGDSGIFIRSMANRGALGGLARATSNVVDALDASGFELIFIETVGSGQAEVDVASAAHSVVVLEAPGLGDSIQALKAGLLEIADILVVNKGDLPGAESTVRALRAALELGIAVTGESDWNTPLLMTSAASGEGIAELAAAIADHRASLQETGEWQTRERQRIERQMSALLRHRLAERFLAEQPDGGYQAAVERVLARQISPGAAINELIREI